MQKVIVRIENELEQLYTEVLDGTIKVFIEFDGEDAGEWINESLSKEQISNRYRQIENLKKQLADLYGLRAAKYS